MPAMVANNTSPTSTTVEATTMPPPTSTNEPPKKRARLRDDAYGAIAERRLEDLETSLEVDYMILDYLLFQAIEACFANQNTVLEKELSQVERCLMQVDEFLALFKMRYGDCKFDPEIRFRLLLSQVVPLFTQRLTRNATTPSEQRLQDIRASNGLRARRWIGEASRLPTANHLTTPFDFQLPLDRSEVERNRAEILESIEVPEEDDAYEDAFYGTSTCSSLLDFLPLFMKVTAACNSMMDIKVRDNWMELATDLMLQACLEQYLVFGASGSDAIDEAFAWGYKKPQQADKTKEAQDDEELNGLFEGGDQGEEEVRGWEVIRNRTLQRLFEHESRITNIRSLLSELAASHPLAETHIAVIGFLQSLAQAVPKPILVQLEGGQLDGMSIEETQEFLRSCGLDLASFFG